MDIKEKLEQALLNNLEDKDTWLVYADYLQSQGDIRGELIVLEYAQEKAGVEERTQALLQEYQQYFLEEAIAHIKSVILTWKRGFIDVLQLNIDSPEILNSFLALKSSQFLQKLHLIFPENKNISEY